MKSVKVNEEIVMSAINNIATAVEDSIINGEWYEGNTYTIEEMKNLTDEQKTEMWETILQYDGEDFQNEGFSVDMKLNDCILIYYIAVDTDVNCGHLNYNLMDKLFTNNYLHYIEDINRYIKVFNQYNTVIPNDNDVIVIDNEQQLKVTFFVDDWGKWEHYVERIEK